MVWRNGGSPGYIPKLRSDAAADICAEFIAVLVNVRGFTPKGGDSPCNRKYRFEDNDAGFYDDEADDYSDPDVLILRPMGVLRVYCRMANQILVLVKRHLRCDDLLVQAVMMPSRRPQPNANARRPLYRAVAIKNKVIFQLLG